MSGTLCCPNCHQALPSGGIAGLCPACLLKQGVAGDTVMAGSFTTPEPDELADLFPQLDILELIGAGGMGVVYKARQRELDRIVALKILPPGIGDDPDFAERFTREAKALAMLNHPGIVTIHDTGRAGGLYFLLMEFIDGLNLQQLLRNGRISPREALAIVPQVCDALQYAHDAGIVHRDIKPENILLDRQGRVKVADFGIVKLMGVDETESADKLAATPRFTQAGLVMGTPQYMAPEQFERPTEVDHRADIYSLGVVLYQMLTGELPGSLLEPPSRKVDLDIHLDEIVLRALEKDPERRYQRIDDVRTVMETLITPTNQPPPVTMDIHFACPSCNQKLSVEPSAAGQEFTCPACSAPIVAPSQQKPVLLTSASPPSGQPLASTAPTAPRPPAIPPPAKRARGLAIWALVLGIIGIIPVVGLATALLAGVLGVVALMKKTTSKGLAIAGTVLGAIGVLMIPVHILILTSAVGGMKFAAGTTVCLTNLKQIGTAIASYQQKHNGQYPDRLETLEKEGLISPKILQCPLHKGGSGNCYDYSRPAGPGASGMLAWDRHPHKTNDIMIGRNVLFDDLSVRMLPEQEFKQSPKAGRQAVRSTPLVVPSVSTRPHVGTRPEVRERPKPEPTPPVEKVMTLASVLEDLKSAQPREMRPLLEFLKDAPASDEHRPQVIQAMKPLLDDVDAGNMAFEVFLHWAGNEQIPDFIEFLRVAPKSPRGKEAMKFLSRTGDERAAEPLAACLADFFTSRDAKAALAALGEVAKPALLPYYHHQDRGVREAARELLRGYHATEEETFAETLKALQNGSTGSRQSAIFDLTAAPLKPEQQLAACRALHPLVTDDERSISDGSRKAMIALATKEDADFLLGLMDSPDDRTRQFATDVLIKLKEPRVAQPLAMQLADPRKTHAAGRALISLGSVAEPAVFPLLKDSELNTRKRAAEVLGEIGTKASLPELEKIARNKKQDNFFARVAAERAIAAIKSRPPNDR